MKVGDLVIYRGRGATTNVGPIIAFNKKGEGGQDYVHVLIDGLIQIYMHFDLEVVRNGNKE